MRRDDFGKIRILGKKADTRMHCIGAGNAGGGDDRGDIQVGLRARGRSDTDGFIRQPYRHRIRVRGGVHDDIRDVHLAAGPQHTKRHIAAIGYEDLLEHYSITTSTSPNSTGCAFLTKICLTVPSAGAVIGFITFIASTMSSVWPFFTVPPTSMKLGASGSGAT